MHVFVTLLRVLVEHLQNDGIQFLGHVRVKNRRLNYVFAKVLLQQFVRCVAGKWRLSGECFKEGDSQAVHVGLYGGWLLQDRFRRNVSSSSLNPFLLTEHQAQFAFDSSSQ